MGERLRGEVCVITGTGGGMGRAAALFLASDDSSYVTGTDLVIDVGMTAW